MTDMKRYAIGEGVSLNCFTDERFKTLRISVDLLIPLQEDTAEVFGMLPSLVSRATEGYPDYTLFGQKLADLYGASINSNVGKIGGYQVISLSAGGLASRYAFQGENMVEELSALLFDILFRPLKDEAGLFPEEGFKQEQRQILENFDAEFNDKILYARQKCLEAVFAGLPQGLGRYGTREKVAALTRGEVTGAWDTLLKQAKYEIFVLGDCSPDVSFFEQAFSGYGKQYEALPLVPHSGEVKTITEDMQLSQSKLVMALKADMQPEERMAFRLMSAVFGGTPSAKLFVNVREKMGLCYYCSSRFYPETAVLTVESGVETENIEKAQDAILEQLSVLQNGELTEDEIQSAKLAMSNSFRSVDDSLDAVESWYLGQCFYDTQQTPESAVQEVMGITKEQIIDAANKVKLDTVYMLKGNGNSN